MTDLYGVLDVGRDATKAEIKKAYRKVAKRSHPDSPTGSRQKFAAVSTALAVLSDDERRRYYDQTGKIAEPPADDRHAKAMNLVTQEIGGVLTAIEQRRGRPEEYDIVGDAKRGLKSKVDEEIRKIEKLQKIADKSHNLAKRFRAKKGKVNRLGPLLDNWGHQHDQTVSQGKDFVEIIKLAISILDDHTFAVDKMPMGY